MFRNTILLLITLQSAFLYAQVQQNARLIAGTETSGQVSIPALNNNNGNFPQYALFRFVPHLSYNVYKNIYVGAQLEYGFGNIENNKVAAQKGVGLSVRYVFSPQKTQNSLVRNRILPYAETSLNALNYTIDYSQPLGYRNVSGYSNFNTQLLLGAYIRLFDRLYMDVATRGMHYAANNKFLFGNRLGFQYHFGEQRTFSRKETNDQNEKTTSRSTKLKPFDFAYFLKKKSIMGRYSFIFDYYDTGDPFYYREHNVGLALAVSITSDITFGMVYQPILVQVRQREHQQYYMFGPIVQYDFIRQPGKLKVFAETGFFKGNLCTCGDDLPYRTNNLSILPVGFGAEAPISKTRFNVSFSLLFYQILDRSLEGSSYGHPTLGIIYRLDNNK